MWSLARGRKYRPGRETRWRGDRGAAIGMVPVDGTQAATAKWGSPGRVHPAMPQWRAYSLAGIRITGPGGHRREGPVGVS
jgi:hypothetical protein